jgi:hypothetical protein
LAADERSACRAEIPNVITAAAMGLYQEARARIGQLLLGLGSLLSE